MKPIIILLIILLGTLLFHNFYNIIEPMSNSCSESSMVSSKLSSIETSVDNFKKETNDKLAGIKVSINSLAPLMSVNRSLTAMNKKKLKSLTKKIQDKMKGSQEDMKKFDDLE